jgi:hypothetical protein
MVLKPFGFALVTLIQLWINLRKKVEDLLLAPQIVLLESSLIILG